MDSFADNWLIACGLGAGLIALAAWYGDRRRRHRRDLDQVGIVPWTSVFFFALLAAVLLLGAAVKQGLAG
jgi:heme A synthase